MREHRTEEVVILPGMNKTWIRFRDATDVELGMRGSTVYRITMSSWQRLLRAINNLCTVEIHADGEGFILTARRNHCPTCGDGDNTTEAEIYAQCEVIEE